jgi:hypothetical protein
VCQAIAKCCYTDVESRGSEVLRVCVFGFFAAHEGFEADDLFAGAEDDEGVVWLDDVLSRRGGVKLSL